MTEDKVMCRSGCGACCIAVSISSAIPVMPQGKPAGVPCIQLDENMCCKIFGQAERPQVCLNLQPNREMCGHNREEAMCYLSQLEQQTSP